MAFLFAYLHFLSFFALIFLLAGEYFLIRTPLDDQKISQLKIIDLVYGIASVFVVATGVARIFLEKGWEYYLGSYIFWAKMLFVLLAGIVSIYPTVLFIKASPECEISLNQYIKIKKAVLLEVMAIPVVVFCAIWMARGIY